MITFKANFTNLKINWMQSSLLLELPSFSPSLPLSGFSKTHPPEPLIHSPLAKWCDTTV